jgi:glycosyltransferase involved in cell wall biosynthesis
LLPPEISQQAHRHRFNVISNAVKTWNRLDDQSCWREFAASQLDQHQIISLKEAFSTADVACVIDWTGAAAYRSIQQFLASSPPTTTRPSPLPIVYMNFRVYSLGVTERNRQKWFDDMELKAIQDANVIVTLSTNDVEYLSLIMLPKHPDKPIEVLLPPLRLDLEQLATIRNDNDGYLVEHLPAAIRYIVKERQKQIIASKSSPTISSKRPLITCVARQSPEKCIQRFVRFVESAADVLQKENFVVVMAGAASDKEYASQARQRLLQAMPSAIVMERFLSPIELGAVYAHTTLNFHPSSYDAYGMTIIEAAAFSAPSVLAGPSVGAFRLLGEKGCLQADMPEDENDLPASSLEKILKFLITSSREDGKEWEELSTTARQQALGWGEHAYGEKLLAIIDKFCAG